MHKRKYLTLTIVFIYVVLFLLTQKNYLANAYTSSTIIPNCLPSANFEDASYDVHVYADKENPSISVNIHNEGIFSEEIICKVPLYSSLSATYTNQISCNVGDTNITPYISFSKKLIKPVDSYLYQEILDTELKSVFVPENIVIIKYTFSSPSAGSISFTTSFESKIFRSFRSHTYESATNRHTINTSTSEEFFYIFGNDVQNISYHNTDIKRQEITLNELMDELLSFGKEFLGPDFPISTIKHFYLSKLYEYLNNSTIIYNFEDLLLPFQNYGFIFYNFPIAIQNKQADIKIEMPLITTKNTLYNPPIDNFSVIKNTSIDFSFYIETNRKLLNNQSFQKQPNGYKFIETDSNEFIFYICDSENPKYKFAKENKLTDWQITLIVLSGIIVICGISIFVYFKCKKKY